MVHLNPESHDPLISRYSGEANTLVKGHGDTMALHIP